MAEERKKSNYLHKCKKNTTFAVANYKVTLKLLEPLELLELF